MTRRSFAAGINPDALAKAGVDVPRGSTLEQAMAAALAICPDIPKPERELKLIEGRKFQSDFVWMAQRVVLEVEGGTRFGKSRHSRGEGFDRDCEKYFLLALRGWLLIRVTGTHIASGQAVEWVRAALASRDEAGCQNNPPAPLQGIVRDRCVQVIQEHPGITVREVAERMGRSTHHVHSATRRLEEQGLVRIERGRTGKPHTPSRLYPSEVTP